MSSAALAVQQSGAVLSITETRRSTQQMVAQRAAIVEAMKSVMKENIDYGKVPGTDKPSLWKPGSEKILSMFNLAAVPTAEDLSTPDTIRYRVHVAITHAPSGTVLGTGIGEASSAESKYQWRGVVCDEEWNQTPEDRRRMKWKRGDRGPYSIKQVRAEMEDTANTVLKMAKKRAQIDAVLTVTAASDVFSQDIEDLVEAGLDVSPEGAGVAGDAGQQTQNLPADLPRKSPPAATQAAPAGGPTPQTNPAPPAQSRPAQQSAPQSQGHVQTITDGQARRFWAIAMQTWGDHTKITGYLRNVLGVQKKEDIPANRYEEAVQWAGGKEA